jgi:hypothetical protein
MNNAPAKIAILLLLFFGSCCARAADPLPPELSRVTSIEIVKRECKSRERKVWHFLDRERVAALVEEIELIRTQPRGIEAAKFACSILVKFNHSELRVSIIHLFPCTALEVAPVSGKRYFVHRAGLNRLPQLSRWLGIDDAGQACQ